MGYTKTTLDRYAKADRLRTRMGALATTLTKTDRILTGRKDVTFRFAEQGQQGPANAPAWNNGKQIFIRTNMLPPIESASGLITCLGLNHHEVCHVLYSPNSNVGFVQRIKAAGKFMAYNLLEDMRIETIFSAHYISAKKYLTAPVLHFIVNEQNAWPTAHLMVHGRRYLPLEIRKELRNRFKGTNAQRNAAEKIIDEYRMMDLSDYRTHVRAEILVSKMHDIMTEVMGLLPPEEQAPFKEHSGCGGVEDFTNDSQKIAAAHKEAGRRHQEEDAAQTEMEEDGEDGSGFYDEEDSEDEPDGGSGNLDDDSEDDGESDPGTDGGSGGDDSEEGGNASNTGNGGTPSVEDDEAEEAGNQGGNASGSAGDSDGDDDGNSQPLSGGAAAGNSQTRVRAMLQKAAEAIEEDSEVQEEITRLKDAMNDDSNVDVIMNDCATEDITPSAESASALSEVIREFQQLHSKFEAGWQYRTDTGRINAQAAMTADFGDLDIYDRWDEGREDDAALEAVILLDDSGSMVHGKMVAAAQATWVIKRALDDLDASSVVMTFSERTGRLYGRGEHASGAVRLPNDLGGETRPEEGMREGRRILNQSDRPNKLIVVITDGMFNGADAMYRDLMESVRATRVYIGIGQNVSSIIKPAFDIVTVLTNPKQISDVIKSAVTSMLDEAYKRR